jgi:hypothetical protein
VATDSVSHTTSMSPMTVTSTIFNRRSTTLT